MRAINLNNPGGANALTKYTTVVNGVDLRIAPDSVREDAVERSAIGSGLYGKVHFLWPHFEAMSMVTVVYSDLTKVQTRSLLAVLGPRSHFNKTIQFVPNSYEPGTIIPGSVAIKVQAQGNGLWTVSIETPAKKVVYGES